MTPPSIDQRKARRVILCPMLMYSEELFKNVARKRGLIEIMF